MKVANTQELQAALKDKNVEQIELLAGTYTGPLAISRSVALQGESAEHVVLQGGLQAVDGITLKLSHLTLAAGPNVGLALRQGEVCIEHCYLHGDYIPAVKEEERPPRGELLQLWGASLEITDSTLEGGINVLEMMEGSKGTIVNSSLSLGSPTVFVKDNSRLDLKSCTLRGGNSAALLVREGSRVNAEDCSIFGGFGTQPGCYVEEEGELTLVRCELRDGKGSGLGVYMGGKATAMDCVFENNDTERDPGPPYDVWCWNRAELSLVRCRVGSTAIGPLDGELTPEAATDLLRKAIEANDIPTVHIALAAGADVHVSKKDGTPLLIAMLDQPYSKVSDRWIQRHLLPAGVDINARDPLGRTAAFFVAGDELLDALDEAGLDIDVVAHDGSTPLHHLGTLDAGHYRVPALLKRGADPNALDNEGQTPLHYAGRSGQRWVTEDLLEAGADLNIQDNAGKTPFEVSKKEARKFLRLRKKAAEKARAKAAPAPDLSDVLSEWTCVPGEAVEHKLAIHPGLEPWWDAIQGADVLESKARNFRLWGASRVVAAEADCPDLPLLAIGDDGLGRWLWVVTEAVESRSAPVFFAFPSELQDILKRSKKGLSGVVADVAPLELSDWLALGVTKKPKDHVKAAKGRDLKAFNKALKNHSLEPLRQWLPSGKMQIDDYDASQLQNLREGFWKLPPLPSGELPDKASVAKALQLESPEDLDDTLWAFLKATRGLPRLPGLFSLECGGTGLEKWLVVERLWRWGGEPFGHEVWIDPDYGGIMIAHHDNIEEWGGHWASFENADGPNVGELVAMEAAMAPFVGTMGLDGEPCDILYALANALNIKPSRLAARIGFRSSYSFLYHYVDEIMNDEKELKRLDKMQRQEKK
ncbi:MAG: hypothetical protein EP343_03310 [Deltaproteobacteria bacterium]|nr:MAG: hypothetical protein EP343_03310 [Deltaproteobacteria bacterium]